MIAPITAGSLDRGSGAGQRHIDGDQCQDPDEACPERDPERPEDRHGEQREEGDVLPRDSQQVAETGAAEVFDRSRVDAVVLAENESAGELGLALRHPLPQRRLGAGADLLGMGEGEGQDRRHPQQEELGPSLRAAAGRAATPSSPARSR